jgi:hypothetical protein
VKPAQRYGGRGSQFVRQWKLLLLLRQGQHTLSGLAQQLGCCQRTIRRDLAVLESAHIPVMSWRINDGGGMDEGGTIYWGLDTFPEWPRREVVPCAMLSP